MRLNTVKSLSYFEACATCPLKKAGLEHAGTSVSHDIGALINAMKKVHPGIIVQNVDPPERIQELVDEDDIEVGKFVVAAWHCVRIKQRHECQNPSVTDVEVNPNIL